MRKAAFLLIPILLLTLLCSCELAYDAPSVGTMHILVYGNDYSTHGSQSNYYYDLDGNRISTANPLNATVNDAVEVGNALVNLAEKADIDYQVEYILGSSTTYINDAVVPSAVSTDVSVSSLTGALADLAENADEADITIIYYSGHGAGESSKASYGTDVTEESYLLLGRDEDDYHVLYPISNFLDLVSAIPGTKVIIGDFCYSGSLVQSGYVSVTDGEYSDMSASQLFWEGDKICEYSSLFCLSAARYYQKSYESGDHGYFTSALLDALGWDEDSKSLTSAKAEKNGMITLFNVANYCIDNDDNSRQTPMLSGGSNDVILFSF